MYPFLSEILGTFEKLWKATVSLFISVFPFPWNNLAPNVRNSMKYDISGFFQKPVEKIQVSLKSDENKDVL